MGKMYNLGESKGLINLGDVFYNELSDTGNMQTVYPKRRDMKEMISALRKHYGTRYKNLCDRAEAYIRKNDAIMVTEARALFFAVSRM